MTQKIHMVEWPGGDMPVPEGTPVIVRRRNGDLYAGQAGRGLRLSIAFWLDDKHPDDIVAYCRLSDLTLVIHPAGTDLSKVGGE